MTREDLRQIPERQATRDELVKSSVRDFDCFSDYYGGWLVYEMEEMSIPAGTILKLLRKCWISNKMAKELGAKEVWGVYGKRAV